ncbi:MAG: glycosyltransferase family 4 protein [Candidatus Niyogibacteria bacterium]|nr:glycosyltransferase family 4 protein [Candidatus Niyogibacteria bacterium]
MTARKKILYIITKSIWGGATKYTYDLAVNLPRDKFEVWIAAGPPKKGENLFVALKNADVHCLTVKNFQKSVNPFKDIFAFFEILNLIKKIKPDIIHVSSSKAGGLAGLAIFVLKTLKPAAYNLKSIFTVHGWAFHENRPEWQCWLIKLLSRLTVFFYDCAIAVSEFDRVSAIKNKIAPAEKIITIHNGINSDSLNFLNKTEARQKLAVPNTADGLWIGTIGEFTKNKGHKFLIEAAAELIKKYPKMKFIIIGHRSEIGGEKQKCFSLIANYSLQNNVFLIDSPRSAAKYLKAFDIFIFPSLKEGLAYALLEAGLAELPVIATETGGNPEIITDQQEGLLIKRADVQEIVKAAEKLAANNNLRQTFAKNLRQKIIREFSFEKQLSKTIGLYLS